MVRDSNSHDQSTNNVEYTTVPLVLLGPALAFRPSFVLDLFAVSHVKMT